ncbi:MAG TPA: phenylalanine--tRNA ligase subunit beta, partial [Gemmatimonadaceae bacterium]|nr:phenylalanine--tRNA ligase subunit beta [Gemmatimonadaceae bacterium]
TTDLFVEVAIFDPRRTRAARRALGLSTDASYRFERSIDPELPPAALRRVASLIVALAGGRIDGAPIDIRPQPKEIAPVTLRVARVRRVLGEPVAAADIKRLLGAIGFTVTPTPGTEMLAGDEELAVHPPSWRGDVVDEIDLVEEVARLVGYDSFPDDLRAARPSAVPNAPHWALAATLRDELVAAGLYEVRPIPFARGGESASFVRLLNPIAENEAFLRRELIDTLARRAEYNLTRMQGDVRIFEIGTVFSASKDALPGEELHVAALVMGARRPPHFTESKPPAFDEWDAKALAERIVRIVRPEGRLELAPANGNALWSILVDGRGIGVVSRVALDAPVWAAPAFGLEISLGAISSERVAPPGRNAYAKPAGADQRKHPSYRPIPTTPAVEFDLALLVPDDASAAVVEELLRRGAGELLERIVLFDEYRGKGVEQGMRSLAWRLTLRHPERTLRDKEVDGRREKLLKMLEHELGIRQRTA